MYYEHFGLKEPPFKITPNTEVFFTGGNRGAVLDAITYAILNGEGIVKVVGEVVAVKQCCAACYKPCCQTVLKVSI